MPLRGYPTFPPGANEVGPDIITATPTISSPAHHVLSTVIISTLTPPQAHFNLVGPTFLIADSVFSWTTSGNIAAAPGTTLVANRAYAFLYQRSTGKWYPMGQDS